MWGIFLFWRSVFRPPNCHDKDTSEPTQEGVANNQDPHYDWSMLNNRDINDKYIITQRNNFDALQEIWEILTPNDEYENFVNGLMEEAAECKPTKLRAKHRVPRETLAVKKKMHPYSVIGTQLMPTLRKWTNTYLKEQTEYIQDQINKIRHSVEDRQFRIAWQTVNEWVKEKALSRAKLKVASQEERIHLRKEHFKNLLGKSP